jgi:hypothetical protein
VLLRAADQPIQRSTGGGVTGRGQVRAQPGVHEDPGQCAWADPKLLGLPFQGGVVCVIETNGDSPGHGPQFSAKLRQSDAFRIDTTTCPAEGSRDGRWASRWDSDRAGHARRSGDGPRRPSVLEPLATSIQWRRSVSRSMVGRRRARRRRRTLRSWGDGAASGRLLRSPSCRLPASASFSGQQASVAPSPPHLQASGEGERGDSNPRPPGPQPGALPTELRPPRALLRQSSNAPAPPPPAARPPRSSSAGARSCGPGRRSFPTPSSSSWPSWPSPSWPTSPSGGPSRSSRPSASGSTTGRSPCRADGSGRPRCTSASSSPGTSA